MNRGRRLWVLIAVGFLLRLGLAALSLGSNDIVSWYRFGRFISAHGIGQAYEALSTRDLLFNTPPLTGLLARAAFWLAGGRPRTFALLFKLPGIAAEAAGACLLYRRSLAREERGEALKRTAPPSP